MTDGRIVMIAARATLTSGAPDSRLAQAGIDRAHIAEAAPRPGDVDGESGACTRPDHL